MRRNRPFTLIELLVVITIIMILAAMLMPTIEKARGKALSATCSSQQKQIMMAMQMYLNESDARFMSQSHGLVGQDYYPNRTLKDTSSGSGDQYGNFQCYLEPHVGSFDTFFCPTSQRTNKKDQFQHDYAMNTIVHGKDMFWFDQKHFSGNSSPADWGIITDQNYEWLQSDRAGRVACRHHHGANVGFLDGHVEFKTWETLRQLALLT